MGITGGSLLRTGRAGRTSSVGSHRAPQPIGFALQDLAKHLGIVKTLRQYSAVTSWESIVGEQIARVASARRIQNGILFVEVGTAPWRNELAMRKLEIMEKINKALGAKVVKDIRFR